MEYKAKLVQFESAYSDYPSTIQERITVHFLNRCNFNSHTDLYICLQLSTKCEDSFKAIDDTIFLKIVDAAK